MAEFPSLPLWTDAVLGDTRNLNTEQFGAYMLMLIVAWRAPDNTLPADDKQLASITGLSKSKWLRSKDLLIKFWTEEDGRLRQKKLDKVKNSVRENAQKNKANADARWLKNKETGNATAVPNGCQTDALHNQNHKEDIHREETPLFEKFWEVFPRQRRGAKDTKMTTADVILVVMSGG